MSRVRFYEPDILPRRLPDDKAREAFNVKRFGKKVRLSDKTIDQLVTVDVPDPTDPEGIRKIRKRINFGDLSLRLEDKLEALEDVLKLGNIQTDAQYVNLIAQLSSIIGNTSNISKLSDIQLSYVIRGIAEQAKPSSPEDAGFDTPFVDGDEYRAKSPEVNFYIYANFMTPSARMQTDTETVDEKGIRSEQDILGELSSTRPIYQIKIEGLNPNLFEIKPVNINKLDTLQDDDSLFDLRYLAIIPFGYFINEDGIIIKIEVEFEGEA